MYPFNDFVVAVLGCCLGCPQVSPCKYVFSANENLAFTPPCKSRSKSPYASGASLTLEEPVEGLLGFSCSVAPGSATPSTAARQASPEALDPGQSGFLKTVLRVYRWEEGIFITLRNIWIGHRTQKWLHFITP